MTPRTGRPRVRGPDSRGVLYSTAVTVSAIERPRTFTRYAVAIFLSSALLFLIEPLAGKRILPLLGGSAAVWTACLVFFQCAQHHNKNTAHWLVTRASDRVQVAIYLG